MQCGRDIERNRNCQEDVFDTSFANDDSMLHLTYMLIVTLKFLVLNYSLYQMGRHGWSWKNTGPKGRCFGKCLMV